MEQQKQRSTLDPRADFNTNLHVFVDIFEKVMRESNQKAAERHDELMKIIGEKSLVKISGGPIKTKSGHEVTVPEQDYSTHSIQHMRKSDDNSVLPSKVCLPKIKPAVIVNIYGFNVVSSSIKLNSQVGLKTSISNIAAIYWLIRGQQRGYLVKIHSKLWTIRRIFLNWITS